MKFKVPVLLIILAVSISSCKLGRFVIYNFADINDHKKFPSRAIEKPETNWQFERLDTLKPPKSITVNGEDTEWREFLEEFKTVAFLMIKNDTIVAEDYLYDYDEASIVPSFSMAKSVVSILIGIAIDEGYIESVQDPATKYLPEMREEFDQVTIEHLLQMTSGLDYNESYVNPFGDAATSYYGRNLIKMVNKSKLETEPGQRFSYVSGDTQILANILSAALGEKSVSAYLEEKLWKPLGMEYDASWSLDKKDGQEKGFCCLNARARDFAKIGRLYLNRGNWNGEQLVPEEWVERSTRVDTSNGSASYYQYQWWQGPGEKDFYANGILGQYIYVNPELNIIAVRLGKKTGGVGWQRVMASLAEKYAE
ncbi:MAG TPA: serine hydrolase [Cryomorphaceae bacterium]|nr:serine hydrolase [Cryomorphaceae bacterium]